jgi:hypothetical protein
MLKSKLSVTTDVLLYCDIAIGIYKVIDTHCSSQEETVVNVNIRN